MIFDDKLLAKLQRLAMIEIDPSKKDQVAKNLNDITSFMDNIATINTDDIQIQYHQNTPLRDDEACVDSDLAQSVLKNAPKSQEGYFIVPKIIE